MKNRKEKQKIYNEKYLDIPKDYLERISWMVDKYNLNEKQMNAIIERKRNMEYNLKFFDLLIILYEEPEGTPRPRFRVINKSNYMNAAIANPNFVHVYQPNAKDDHVFMTRMLESDLLSLNQFVQTPCTVQINSYFKTPSSYSIADTILAEYGLDWDIKKPDWDNIGKKYSDMFNSNVWLDDNMVISGSVNKFYSILPRIEIYLRYLNYAPNMQQYKNIINKKEYKQDFQINSLDKFGNINVK